MAGNIYDWSTTAGSNATADGDINWAEGQFPSTVNNSARQMMARVAQWLDDNGVLTVTGTNTIAVTTNSPILTIATGMTLSFRAAATNTTAVTLNVNGLGGKDIRKVIIGGTDSVPLDAGDINIKGVYVVVYDATTNGGVGGWIILNPATSAYLALTGGTLTGPLELVSTDAGAGESPTLSLYRNSASPAASDIMGVLRFYGKDSAGNKENYIDIYTQIDDATSGSEDGRIVFRVVTAGTVTERLRLASNGASITGDLGVTGLVFSASSITASTGLFSSTDVTAATNFVSSTTNVVLAPASAGGIFLRPNGSSSTVGQAVLASSGSVAFSGDVASTQNFASSTANLVLAGAGGGIFLRPNGTGSSAGNVTIDASGNLVAAGNVTAFSDLRLKSDIEELTDTGKIIDAIEGKRFTKDGKPGVGFIAQDIQVHLPELIERQSMIGDEGETYLSVAYGNLTAVLWNEVKDLRKRLAALESK
ncbi:tail fiber domain-containing protein [Phyllobacterium sp. LjRoot231]|uniref:tail fiber domain-containing protein n=1 Tax=Phyllobacterium sp. LjRoot231 TaxID=3342289 RepID=UPI003ECFE41E